MKLYHYTTYEGFLGMMKSKSIWLTNIHYQNDSQEFYNALSLIKKIIEDEYPGLDPEIFNLNINKIYPVYTFSLTTEKDLLSQWRGYCPNGGYSIAINFENFDLESNGLVIKECIYDEVKKREIIQKEILLGVTPEIWASTTDEYFEPSNYLSHKSPRYLRNIKIVKRKILEYAAIMKHESFAEEKEQRIYTVDKHISVFGGFEDIPYESLKFPVNFRTGSKGIIPYLQVPIINDPFDQIPIDELVIGPTPHKILAMNACQLLLNSATHINHSTIPYRFW